MRSYHSHVETLLSSKRPVLPRKPCFRASAIFPARQEKGCRTRILFMGYWAVKRNILDIQCVSTLRTQDGSVLTRVTRQIQDGRTHRIELADLLEASGLDRNTSFNGSLEVEFFSAENLFFPFPAAVVNYYGPQFSSVVHSAQRVYNDFDDFRDNSVKTVPESGFNIYSDGDKEGFFTLINGPEESPDCTVKVQVFNSEGSCLEGEIPLGRLAPYQSEWVTLSDHLPLKNFLKKKVGCVKITFDVHWIYPRLVVGNAVRSLNAINVTHSYYDCTDAKTSGDYWHSSLDDWYPASLLLPLSVGVEKFSNAYFYPIISPSDLHLHVEIYDGKGSLLGRKDHALHIESPAAQQYCIPFKEICKELKINTHQSLCGRVIAETDSGKRLPARLKIGLDLGAEAKGIPCNVCTNLHPFNPSLEHKPECFRWAPILADQEHASVWILNSSPAKNYKRSATVQMLFHREADSNTLARQYILPAHGHTCITIETDPELSQFCQGQVAWFTAHSDNPYLSTYFFAEHHSGVVGGDHGF